MIIGDGLIANAFRSGDACGDVVVVASGVSNSSETRDVQFERERKLLTDLFGRYKNWVFVYFSSCALVDEAALAVPYYQHKFDMERMVRQNVDHLIVRLPQLIGRSPNPNTIINAFRKKLADGEEVSIQKDAYRYFIDIYDVVSFVRRLCMSENTNTVVDFANPHRYSAESVLLAVARTMGISAPAYRLVDGGIAYELDFSAMKLLLEDKDVYRFGPQYLCEKLESHYRNINKIDRNRYCYTTT